MPRAVRTALSVAALAAANVLAGRLITGPLRDLPGEHALGGELRRRAGPRVDPLALLMSRSSDTSRAILAGLAITAALLPKGRTAAAPALAMVMASATHVVSSSIVRRERPAGERFGTEQPTFSFPSGHVGAMTALAVVLGRVAEPLPVPARVVVRGGLVTYLALLGWSRLHNGQHYATDIAAGYVNGVVCGRLAAPALHGTGEL